MSTPLGQLPAKERRGSRARALLITHGPAEEIAPRLTALVAPHATILPNQHVWAPCGLGAPREARLGKTPEFLSPEQREAVSAWWLAVRHPAANTPNWDIVSQATVGGREGLVLIEAKAHDAELIREEAGKRCDPNASESSRRNHAGVADCIAGAGRELSATTGLDWSLSRDRCYQMANRFAWAWKLASLGVPVVLVYLGFLNADEMRDRGNPFARHEDWETLVRSHSRTVCPDEVWGKRLDIGGVALTPLIRTLEVPLPRSSIP